MIQGSDGYMDGVTLGNKHSYDDWGLILNEKEEISSPEPKTNYLDVPGADGSLDMSELFGDVKYENRTITWEFLVIRKRERWNYIYSNLLNYLHGQKMNIILDDDPSFFYRGRVKVNQWKSDKRKATIVVEAEVEPYKYELSSSIEPWLWDPFNFEDGIIREYGNLQVDGEIQVNIIGRRKMVIPTFIVSSDDDKGMDIIFKSTTYHLPDGESSIINVETTEGDNIVTIKGNGVISIDYRGGSL